jgi:release factor glutamine methyltransferase
VTLREAAARARARLEQASIPREEASLDAELLARDVLGCDRAAWITRQHEPAPQFFEAPYEFLVARRERREPMAYIRGRQEFYGRDFVVTPDVLIPRPETELLIDEALLLLPALGFSRSLRVIDIGTGSGCIAITLALEFPEAEYFATDVSPAALDVARNNAARLNAAGRITFVQGSLLGGVSGPCNLIVSNPPYVAEQDRPSLQAEVAQYEPAAALFGGPDGLAIIRQIVHAAEPALEDDGTLLLEIGAGQLDQVAAIAGETERLALVRSRADLQGIPRVAVIRRCR